MAKGFGIAALVFALIAIFIPFGIFVSIIAIVLAIISALAGDRIFATATALIALINTFFFSPSTWIVLGGAGHEGTVTVSIIIGAALPFVAMALNAVGRASGEWPTYSQKQAMANTWSAYGVYIIVVGILIPIAIYKGPSWVEYVKERWSEGTHIVEPPNVPTIPVDIGPTTQVLLGTAGHVQGIRIVTADEIPKTIQPGGPTAVGNDVLNGMHYVCYLADVNTCEVAFKQEANLERAAGGNGSTGDVTTGQQIPQAQTPTAYPPIVPPQENELPSYPAPIEETHWDHNGSLMKLEMNGTGRRFLYIEPREGMREVGVTQGMVAFNGTQTGNVYIGTAYVFSRICGAIGYPVNGAVDLDERSITLRGYAPYVDAQCRRAGGRPGVLVFQLTNRSTD